MDNNKFGDVNSALLHTYNRFPVCFEKGDGNYLYDVDGKSYLDFASGIGVCALGYNHLGYTNSLKKQIDLLTHTSNLFYNPTMIEAAQALKEISEMDRVFFTNSGTEAIEGALKAARKYAYSKDSGKHEIIAMNHSFHGRSMGAVSVTGTEKYRIPFEPLIGGVRFAEFNDYDSVLAQVSEKTCAIILEPIQGEGGIHPAEKEFLEKIRKLCDEKDIILIFDEIQCGVGRTGTMFAWQGYGVKPDIVTMAKGIGNGFPVGAFAMTENVAKYSLQPGDHGTTYGGNPLACAAVLAVIRIFKEEKIVEHVNCVSKYLEEQLDVLCSEKDGIIERRGKGLMQGLVLTSPVGDVVNSCINSGLIVISAGGNVLRMLPPLTITEKEIDQMIDILKKTI